MTDATQTETTQIQGLVDDVLSTPTLKLPPTPPEAHQGKIDGVQLDEFDSGAVALTFTLSSTNVSSVTDTVRLFIPKLFAEDIHVDPSTLPAVERIMGHDGTVLQAGDNQQQQYAIGIANSDGTATLQEVRRIAYEQGRTTEGMEAPTNIAEYVDVLNHLVVGIDVVFTRRPNTKAEDPRFRNRLQGSAILSPNVVNNPKQLKKYVKLWEVQD